MTQTGKPSLTAGQPDCAYCHGMRFYVPDLPLQHPEYGRAIRCEHCNTDTSRFSGLTATELTYSAASIQGKNDTVTALRYLVDHIAAHPAGWLTLWGPFGTAKTMTMQAIIAGLVRQNRNARFYHAKQIEQGWFNDMHDPDHSAQAQLFLNTPFIAIDELDKVNLNSEWIRQQFQNLLDHRYRQAVAGKQLTLITLNSDPVAGGIIPGDIVSRMEDGRFYRQWTGKSNSLVIDRWGEKVLPGCIQVKGADARPYLAPEFVREKKGQPV